MGLKQAMTEAKKDKLSQPSKGKQNLSSKGPRKNFHLEHVPSDEMDLLITSVNEADVGFKLDTCKLQKNHNKFGEGQDCTDENDEIMLLQLGIEADVAGKAGIDKQRKHFGRAGDEEFKVALDYAQ